MADKIICSSCGASYDRNMKNCPYCGNANFYGQEKEYMRGLAGLRQRFSEIADIDKSVLLKEFGKVFVYIVAVAAVIVAIVVSIISFSMHQQAKKTEKIRDGIIYEIQ